MPLIQWLAALPKRRRKTGDSNAPEPEGTVSERTAPDSVEPGAGPSYHVTVGSIPLRGGFAPYRVGPGGRSLIRDAGDLICAVVLMILIALLLLPLAPDRLVRAVEDRVGIRVRRTAEPSVRFFSVGATEQEVLSVQGRPTAIKGDTWFYGQSQVDFARGRVIGWRSSGDYPLRTPIPVL